MSALTASAAGVLLFLSCLAQGVPEGTTLEASIGSSDRKEFVARSGYTRGKGDPVETRVTDQVLNHQTDSAAVFLWKTKEPAFAGKLPAATKQKGEVVPVVRTQQWNTFRPLHLREGRVTLNPNDPNRGETLFTGMLFRPDANPGKAVKGQALYGKLIDGDEKGKVLLTFTSTIQDDGPNSYEYKYTATNSSNSLMEFEWAGFKEKLEPGKSFSRAFKSAKLTAEVSGTTTVSFKEGSRYTITANHWQRPE